jgi:glucuronate isomerase
MIFFGHLDARKGWTKQLHLGAYRNANTRMLQQVGPNTGFDSIGDWPQVESLAAYCDQLDRDNSLPQNAYLQCESSGQLYVRHHGGGTTPRKVYAGRCSSVPVGGF